MTLTASARKLLEQATVRYEADLDKAASYLAARGLTEQAARTYRLGYVTGEHPADSEYANRLAIPYVTPAGGVVDIRYRALDDSTPKYLSRAGAKTRLFGVTNLLVESPVLYVTEGELDCCTSSAMCGLVTVGVPGANNWQPHFKLLMADYVKVVVLCDGDEAGRQFGKTVCREVDTAVAVSMPAGMDVNDLFLQGGREAVLNRVSYE